MDRWIGKVAVVTGASSGIGLAIAKSLIENGMTVVGLARREDKMKNELELVKGRGKFFTRKCDISDEQQVIEAFNWIKTILGNVHVLVNNAGVLTFGSYMDTDRKDWEKITGVNVMGLLYCTQQAIKIMKEMDVEGHIININSVSGHEVRKEYVQINIYPATKHAVTAITKGLEYELLGSKIRITSISPGYVKTEIVRNIDHKSQQEIPYTEIPGLEPEDIAESVVYVLGTPQRVLVSELTVKPFGFPF